MSLKNQIIVIVVYYFIPLLYLRCFLYGLKRYQLTNSSYKKRKQGETFKEWLLYSRYTEEIPRILRILYYIVLLIHPVCIIISLLLYLIKPVLSFNIGKIFVISIVGFDTAWMLVIALLFWSNSPDYAYQRWIARKHGQKRGKK